MPSTTNPQSSGIKVHIGKLNRFNWELTLDLRLHEYQEDYLPDVLYSLAQSKFEDIDPYGIFLGNSLVGYLMVARVAGLHWINRIMVDKHAQQKGIGSQAMTQILKELTHTPGCTEIRTSFMRSNAFAEYFFSKVGFQKIGDGLEDEIVMRYRPR